MSTLQIIGRLRTLAATSLFAAVTMYNSIAWADYAAAVLADKPLGYWRFNEAAGSLAANAGSAGAEMNGEYIDAPRVPGPDKVGNRTITGLGAGNLAISVGDPDPSYVAVDAQPMNDVLTETGFSFEGWVNPGPRETTRIGLWGQNDVPEFGFIAPNTIQLWTPSSSVDWVFTEDDIPDEAWFHVAATSSSEETNLYINGEFVMTGPGSGNETFGNSAFTFNIGGGGVYDPTGNQFLGLIDEVAIWTDKVLTEDQIAKHYEAAFATTTLPGDFNKNGTLDLPDINDLTTQTAGGTNPAAYDLNADAKVDVVDVNVWVKTLRKTWIGDSDLNGEFNSSDFVKVFTAGKYEQGTAAVWEEGDWNGSGRFDSTDFVSAFQDGGYEKGPVPPAVAAVPEPASGLLLGIGGIALLAIRRRTKK